MTRVTRRLWAVVLFSVVTAAPGIVQSQDNEECCESAPRRWSAAWYEQESCTPVGAPQRFHMGKLWPPWPRPTGKRQQFSHKFHAAHYWPHPYVCQDRHFVRSILDRQVTNGWVASTTLYDYHFDPTTHELTHAGRLHLRWILEETPEKHRLVFVQTAESSDASQERMAGVRSEATARVGDGNVPPIMPRATSPLGRPAAEIVNIHRAELLAQPVPRVPLSGASSLGGADPSTGQ